MISAFNGLRDINTVTILFRMILAILCGGLIGIERSAKNRPAGFRTHILIIIGATTASLTGHYIYLVMNLRTVKGLTTAAGLWATGIIGLAIGAGFYEGAILGTVCILFSEIVLGKIKIRRVKAFRCIINYQHKETLDHILRYCKDRNIAIKALQIEGETDESGVKVYSAFVTLQPNAEIDHAEFVRKVESFDGVINAIVR